MISGGRLSASGEFMRGERRLLYFIIFVVMITSLLTIAGPFLVGQTVDNYLVVQEFDGLIGVLIFIFFVYLMSSATQYLASFLMVGLARKDDLQFESPIIFTYAGTVGQILIKDSMVN